MQSQEVSLSVTKSTHKAGRIGFVSLGCPKATVDSERILTQLRAEGYDLVNHYNNADMVIVNTCGFIDEAVQESLDTIQEAMNENGKVIVTGCLGVKQDMINERFPNLLAVTGPQATDDVMLAVHKHLPPSHDPFMDLVPAGGMKLTPRHYAYLKISEGCNQKCTFCIIPTMRGKLVSRPISQVMSEAEALVSAGVKELLIVSQDSGAYGVDVKYKPEFYKQAPLNNDILTLAKALGSLGVWVRLHYVYPYPSIDKLIPLMAEGIILPYLDIPFQHASHSVLKAMKRPASQENVLKRIKAWREICPELIIRSTFIVGFPGETEEDFQELLDFLTEAQLDRVGCFKYSAVEGAVANALADHVDEAVKEDRWNKVMALQAEISANKLAEKIGYEMQVLIDDVIEEAFDDPSVDFENAPPIVMTARSYMDAPEIDGVMHIIANDASFTWEKAQQLKGTFVDVEIIAATEYDLIAKLI